MSDLSEFFEDRKKEVENYFNFLKALEIDSNTRFNLKLNNAKEFAVSKEQTKIFKSNCFLLLYNAVEGTVNKSIESVFNAINDENIKYKELIKEIKAIWLKYTVKNAMEEDMALLADYIDMVSETTFNLNLEEFLKKNKSYFSAGTLDSLAIKDDISKRIGLGFNEKEPSLQLIKYMRNFLAHGQKSFAEIGQEKLLSEIEEYKNKSFEYLKKYVEYIEEYIDRKTYKSETEQNH
ncbi:MAG: hypothetical protein GY795_02455 [Desulfobacterales bacterium]|nr:hypothetical protein [Desulfobacterales bacterium]